MISLTDVTMTYGDLTVLGPVTLDIPAGGITALVGPNGAGKSTLLTIVGRLATATSGRATIAGNDVTTTPGRALAKIVSILRQENHFVTRLTVRELVGFGRFPHSQGRLTAEDHVKIDEAIAFLDLTELSGRYLDQLSGGQRQRAYVAMVLAQDTDYILLDEPLNNLDMKHAVAMMGQLRRAVDELGKTIVIVVHDINFAAAYADRIVALADGQVVHVGTPDELMTPTTLEQVFGTPVDVRRDGPYPLAVYYR
ncbi:MULTISPECIES: iron ABC transporter ATP-binding protein [unclassified Microbacterium]|uniref:iron ABC transporter ATP-binding protein n=1 Tax=unclassified Microbacterium TaxID=2609290 RepID=UPI0006FB75DB|nr:MULTISPECIES: ATP-binding cassette domain-containing protein [unclassified Microbacterium]MBD8207756.1 ATP-binding cassette domain-containing protein [Microbacterium sp. CFBP 8801]MBD8219961.1 ATP-binding cassette domain-containing protein [Microbacterium sp. CFBP 13617]MBD8479261.1 ATP-binding cassette domain-containing protein [Microbacterium sp. CFBP 8794]MBD8510849.1 ATP-binding cassette domain-containing protein [Microbacterium sp. CFBP 8790]AOX46470.1 iron ABC transporter ATP-binding 